MTQSETQCLISPARNTIYAQLKTDHIANAKVIYCNYMQNQLSYTAQQLY